MKSQRQSQRKKEKKKGGRAGTEVTELPSGKREPKEKGSGSGGGGSSSSGNKCLPTLSEFSLSLPQQEKPPFQ